MTSTEGSGRFRPPIIPWGSLLLGLLLLAAAPAVAAEDPEASSHGDQAATYQRIQTYRHPGFEVDQYQLAVLSHYSYLLVSDGEALLVDPGRDVGTYLEAIRERDLELKGVYLTHSHADFVAGHMEIAHALDVPVHVSGKGEVGYPHRPLEEGSVIPVGSVEVRILETPGHTPDGTCGVVHSEGSPRLAFTGDTLFVGSVGRPDLLTGKIPAAALASMAFDSWHQKLARLPNEVVVLPAHGAGSLCGANLRDEPSTTIGEERRTNPYLQHETRGAFVASILEGLPSAPAYFAHNAAMNRRGPPLVDWEAPLRKAEPVRDHTDPERYYVVDIRSTDAYAAGHVPNAVNIGLRGRLETWTGTMVPWGAELVLVCGGPKSLREAVHRLHRIGYQARTMVIDRWRDAGLPVRESERIEPRELYQSMQRTDAPLVVDVRLPEEWMGMRIGTVANMPLNRLPELSSNLDPTARVVTVCNSAYRSSLAVGVLERQGFQEPVGLTGGTQAWIDAGLPVRRGVRPATAALDPTRASPKGGGGPGSIEAIRLPDRISPEDLARRLKDLPGTFDLVDLRPAGQFGDYHVPGSRNLGIAAALADPGLVEGEGTLVLVDRDGSLAMPVGGALLQRTERDVKVLHGGLEAYWRAMHPARGGAPPSSPTASGSSPPEATPGGSSSPRVPAATVEPGSPPATPQQRSAGC